MIRKLLNLFRSGVSLTAIQLPLLPTHLCSGGQELRFVFFMMSLEKPATAEKGYASLAVTRTSTKRQQKKEN